MIASMVGLGKQLWYKSKTQKTNLVFNFCDQNVVRKELFYIKEPHVDKGVGVGNEAKAV